MQWTNLWHSPMQADSMNVGTAIIMMLVDSLIYFFIAWYISHVNPRKYLSYFHQNFKVNMNSKLIDSWKQCEPSSLVFLSHSDLLGMR
jgi:hypothetical protein